MTTEAQVTDHVIYDVLLLSDIPPSTTYSTNMAMLDEDSVPVDKRILFVSPTSYKADLPAGSVAVEYAAKYFGQALKANVLQFGRRIETDTAPIFLWGPSFETDYLIFKAIADGEFTVLDSAAAEDDVLALDFSAITDISQVYPIIEAGLQNLVGPNITGLDTATVTVDALGRIAINMPATVVGATSPTISLIPVAGGAGTDLIPLMDATNGTSVLGYDAETILESFSAIQDKDDGFYNVEAIRATDADNLLLAGTIQSLKKQLSVVTKDILCGDPSDETSIMSLCEANGYDRTLVTYDADLDTQFVSACVEGRMLPTEEGTTNWAYTKITGATSNKLSVGFRKAIKAKHGNYIETIGSATYLYPGITSGNVEKRLILGIDWFEDGCQNDNFAIMLALPLLGWDNDTIALIQGVLDGRSETAIDRKIFVDTPGRPFIINLPDADDFTQEERASHTMEIENAFSGWANSAVNDILVRGSVTI